MILITKAGGRRLNPDPGNINERTCLVSEFINTVYVIYGILNKKNLRVLL